MFFIYVFIPQPSFLVGIGRFLAFSGFPKIYDKDHEATFAFKKIYGLWLIPYGIENVSHF